MGRGDKLELTAVMFACASLTSTSPFTGGRASPWSDELPPLLAKCTLMVKKLAVPSNVSHSATRGFLLETQAGFSGSMRPGLNFRDGPGNTSLAEVAVPGLGERSRKTRGS